MTNEQMVYAAQNKLFEENQRLRKQLAEVREDEARLDYLESNPFVQIHFTSPDRMSESLKDQFPLGFWRILFGPKDFTNRFSTIRGAIDQLRALQPEEKK